MPIVRLTWSTAVTSPNCFVTSSRTMWPSASVANFIRSYGFDGPRRVLLVARDGKQGPTDEPAPDHGGRAPPADPRRRSAGRSRARGLTALRLADVADEAGVSVGTIQHYFGTRERLLLETFAFETERALERWRLGRAQRHERLGTGARADRDRAPSADVPGALDALAAVLGGLRARSEAAARDGRGLRPLARSVPARDRGRGRVRRVRPGARRRTRSSTGPSHSSTGSRCRSSSSTGHEPRAHARAPRREPRGRPGSVAQSEPRSGESAARAPRSPRARALASSGT